MDLQAWAGIFFIAYAAIIVPVAGWLWFAVPNRITAAFFPFAVGSAAIWLIWGLIVVARWQATADWLAIVNPAGLALNVPVYFTLLFWLRLVALVTEVRFLSWFTTRQSLLVMLPVVFVATLALVLYNDARLPYGQELRNTGGVIVGVVAIVAASIRLRQSSPGTPGRRRAIAYLLAFLAHDLGMVLATGWMFMFVLVDSGPIFTYEWHMWFTVAIGLLFIFIPSVTYGIVSGRILDGRQKLRTTISNTSAVAFIAMAFLVMTEVVEQLFNINNPFVAVTLAVLLAIAFRPVQRIAERGARRMLPAEPVTIANYRDAVERALADGQVTRKEQRVLDELQARMS